MAGRVKAVRHSIVPFWTAVSTRKTAMVSRMAFSRSVVGSGPRCQRTV
jgi:hypothetical protein